MTPRFLDWAIGLSTVPFTDLGKMGGEGELAKKGPVVIFVKSGSTLNISQPKNITPSKAESQKAWN